MIRRFVTTGLLLCFVLCLRSPVALAQEYRYTFDAGYEGWTGDFADYPTSDSLDYALSFSRTRMPAPLDTTRFALRISGINRSDDLFMFLKRKVGGLQPSTQYLMQVDMELASNAPTNAAGVGGPPGEGVVIKAGATVKEPMKVIQGNQYVMNIDKANQSMPGADMDTLGHVGVTDTTTQYAMIKRSNAAHPFTVQSDANGEVWVCVGTDSGFEGLTTLYYQSIALTFSTVTSVDEERMRDKIYMWPQPANDFITLSTTAALEYNRYVIVDVCGSIVGEGILRERSREGTVTRIDINDLAPGLYCLRIAELPPASFVVN